MGIEIALEDLRAIKKSVSKVINVLEGSFDWVHGFYGGEGDIPLKDSKTIKKNLVASIRTLSSIAGELDKISCLTNKKRIKTRNQNHEDISETIYKVQEILSELSQIELDLIVIIMVMAPYIKEQHRLVLIQGLIVEETYKRILNSANSKGISIAREASVALEKVYGTGE